MSLELEIYPEDRYPDDPGGMGPSGPNRAMRTLGIAAFIAALFILAYMGVQWLADSVQDVITTEETTVESGIPVTFEIASGESAAQIARELDEAGVVASGAEFERVVLEARASSRLQAGVFELETGMEPETVLAVLLEGPAGSEVYRITVIEALTVGQTLESISRQTGFTLEELTAALLDGTVTSALLPGEPEALRDWEGLLFPDTYEFAEDATAADILIRMAATAEERVAAIDWTLLEEKGLTPYDGIIIASLIEEEVVVDEDRPLVGSVVHNRLDLGMKLQLDVTVVYALGAAPEGGLTFEDLEVNSPYNTYLIDGLPPTPIAGVRVASLRAAAEPAETDYLFFIAIDDSGKMDFTADFDEFLELQNQLEEAGTTP
jgi:UPF0755 protein